MTRPIPDFIIGGAAKSGTTALWHYVGRHPSVCLADSKEPMYFVSRSVPDTIADVPGSYFAPGNHELGRAWYENLFSGRSPSKLCGEATPSYFHRPEAATLIAEEAPQARLIFLLRDPTDRIVSHYWHDRRLLHLPSLENLIKNNDSRYRFYRWISCYTEHVQRLFKYFDRSQVLLLASEELAVNPSEALRRTFRFLGLETSVVQNIDFKPHNQRGELRSRAVQRLIDWPYGAPGPLKPLGRRIRERLRSANVRTVDRGDLDNSVRATIARDLADDVQDLQDLLGRTFPWKL